MLLVLKLPKFIAVTFIEAVAAQDRILKRDADVSRFLVLELCFMD